ncbi:MAG: nucleoside hydrolase [Thermodesulfobacteriota bacterium]
MRRRRVVLDTDIGTDADDALCLALALASPEVDLVAVTTVTRDAARRAAIARRLLDLAGRPDVPVYSGCERPIEPGGTFLWLGDEGDFVLAPGERLAHPGEHAVDALARLLAAEEGLELVAVGPLTNVATLLHREPSLARRVARLTVMGGHLRRVAYGEHVFPPGVDYNLCSDAAASMAVLRAGIPTTLVTADVTLETRLAPEDLERIAAVGTPFHDALAAAVRAWTPHMRRIFRDMGATIAPDNVAFLHDPLALAAVYDPSACRFEQAAIVPVIENGVLRTLEAPPGTPGARPMRCATSVDAERFRAHFVSRLTSYRGGQR